MTNSSGKVLPGISVILPCFNSATRIEATLRSLACQRADGNFAWEIILVDNNSTDDTVATAMACWENSLRPAKLTIVSEQKQGLRFAREKGIAHSRFSILIFCDDDNWLSAGYLQIAWNLMAENPHVSIFGGNGSPVAGVPVPSWFDEYQEAYAVGSQVRNIEDGRFLQVYGAGMVIRRSAIDDIEANDFGLMMAGRAGGKLSSSEDTELCLALTLMGHIISYSADLTFQHYLPASRLQLSYLRKIFTAFGTDQVIMDLYYSHITKRRMHRAIQNWYGHLMLALIRLIKYQIVPPKAQGRPIYRSWSLANIRSLWELKRTYRQINNNISELKKRSMQNRSALQDTMISGSWQIKTV
jgi:glycosyltransferase involved in cell wall biosynthesis